MSQKCKEYTHFTQEERTSILQMCKLGLSIRAIGKLLGRDASSISRELRRNKHPFPGIERKLDVYERARAMHEQALKRRKIPRRKSKLESDPELEKKVIDLITEEQASPRDIEYRIPDELFGKSISYSTIYNLTKLNRTDLRKYFRSRGKARKQRLVRKRSYFKNAAPRKRNISERPSWVSLRIEYGHFEVDTIHPCKGGSGAILSIREMKSRMRWYFKIADLQAETALAVVQGFFRLLPPHMIKTLTADNGPENALLSKLENIFPGLKVYYCDPYSAYQRGGVENSNGEFRWYYPKGTDFKDVSRHDVWQAQDKLNRRRMRCLGGKSAAMVFEEACKNVPLIMLAGAQVLSSKSALWQAAFPRFEQKSGIFLPSPAL